MQEADPEVEVSAAVGFAGVHLQKKIKRSNQKQSLFYYVAKTLGNDSKTKANYIILTFCFCGGKKKTSSYPEVRGEVGPVGLWAVRQAVVTVLSTTHSGERTG